MGQVYATLSGGVSRTVGPVVVMVLVMGALRGRGFLGQLTGQGTASLLWWQYVSWELASSIARASTRAPA